MAKKSSTALVFNPFSGILDTNPRRHKNLSKGAKGAAAVGLIAGVAAVVAMKIGEKSAIEAAGQPYFSAPSMKGAAVTGGITFLAAGLITYGLTKFG